MAQDEYEDQVAVLLFNIPRNAKKRSIAEAFCRAFAPAQFGLPQFVEFDAFVLRYQYSNATVDGKTWNINVSEGGWGRIQSCQERGAVIRFRTSTIGVVCYCFQPLVFLNVN